MLTDTDNLDLIGQGALAKHDLSTTELDERAIGKRAATSACVTAGVIAGIFAAAVTAATGAAFTFGALSVGAGSVGALAGAGVSQACISSVQSSSGTQPIGIVALGATLRSGRKLGMGGNQAAGAQQAQGGGGTTPTKTSTGSPKTITGMVGQYSRDTFAAGVTDCAVTYTCVYGSGWDEVSYLTRYRSCGVLTFRRYATIKKGVLKVSLEDRRSSIARVSRAPCHYWAALLMRMCPGVAGAVSKAQYSRVRNKFYRKLAQTPINNVPRCQA